MMNRMFGLSAALAEGITSVGIAVTIIITSIAAVLSIRFLISVGSEVRDFHPPLV
jgi:hypothetical protein